MPADDYEARNWIEKSIYAAWTKMDREKIMQEVDRKKMKTFINDCAKAGAASGAGPGVAFIAGGPVGVAPALAVDLGNVIYQQQKIATGVVYSHTDRTPQFNQLMAVIGRQVGAAAVAGMAVTRVGPTVQALAAHLAVRFLATTPVRAVPLAGSAVGASTNYLYLRKFGRDLNAHAPRILKLIDE